jgi:rSAM/selenodomain-associated transferase 2
MHGGEGDMKLSIVVPILNEAQQLPELFAHLLPMKLAGCEIVFVDGGSSDGSARLAKDAGYEVVASEVGRARQMNAGAAVAEGDVLLFLHADTRLPEAAQYHVLHALDGGHHCWGRFDVCITGRPFMLRVVAWMMNWRSRLTGMATGDQAIFVRRNAFEQLHGYPDQPLMEDVELCKRLKALSSPACLAQCVTTSGRRWEARGVWKTIFLMWRLRLQYWLGTDAHYLTKLYR